MEWEDVELTNPYTHEKYINMWNNSHRILNGNCQKNSHTNKAARKIST